MSDLFEDLDQRWPTGSSPTPRRYPRAPSTWCRRPTPCRCRRRCWCRRDELAELLAGGARSHARRAPPGAVDAEGAGRLPGREGRKADGLLEEVRVQTERMVQRTEIVRQANHVAQRILDDANEEARRLRHEAEDYADQKLASFEIVLDRTLKTVQAGREKLQVTPIPDVEIGEGGDTRWLRPPAPPSGATNRRASSTRTSPEGGRGPTGMTDCADPSDAGPSSSRWPPCASRPGPPGTSTAPGSSTTWRAVGVVVPEGDRWCSTWRWPPTRAGSWPRAR